MKSIFKYLSLPCVALALISCSDDDSGNNPQDENARLLKSVIYPIVNNPDDELTVDLSQHYFYDAEHNLAKADGDTKFNGEYFYSNNRLSERTKYGTEYMYEYDDQGRITKLWSETFGDYTELFYEEGKVITHIYHVISDKLEKRELLLDQQGRIIKMTDLDPATSVSHVDSVDYIYDKTGNITSIIRVLEGNSEPETINYTYEETKNPYYYSFKKHYETTYYLENSNGLSVYNNKFGLCPNMVAYENTYYTINENGYPTAEYTTSPEGITNEICTYNYF